MSMEVGHAMPSVRGEAAAGGHAARHLHALLHALLHAPHAPHALRALHALRATPGRLTAAGDQGLTTLCANSEEGADSPHSSDATELGPIGGELRVRNREPPAPSQHTALCTPPPHSLPAP